MMNDAVRMRYAQLYDVWVPDWPGEIDFYKAFANDAKSRGLSVLELGCGTGRVAVRLAQEGVNITGLDLSSRMLDEARAKSILLSNARWIQGDMCEFELGEQYGLVIIPGHAFMNVIPIAAQMSCLSSIRRHLYPGGRVVIHVDHQDMRFLANASGDQAGLFGEGQTLENPKTGYLIKAYKSWTYSRSIQTAYEVIAFEEVSVDGQILDRWESEPLPVHCMFRFEMEHLLARSGFQVEALYGDFFKRDLSDESSEMIWVVS